MTAPSTPVSERTSTAEGCTVRCRITVRRLGGGWGVTRWSAAGTARVEIVGDLIVDDVEVVLAGLARVARRGHVESVVCDVGGLTMVGLHTVDALARLRLGTCRRDWPLVLSRPSRALRNLIHLAGLHAQLPG